MKTPAIAALALSLALAACAPNGSPRTTLTPEEIQARTAWLGPTHTSKLYPSGADCAPDLADPIWGPNQEFLGYSCFRPMSRY